MRPMTRRKKVMLARRAVVLTAALLVVILMYGALTLIGNSTNHILKKLTVSITDSMYIKTSCKVNGIFDYFANNNQASDTIVSGFFEQIPLNYYAVHNAVSPSETFFVNEDDFYEINHDTNAAENEDASLIVEYEKGNVLPLPDYQPFLKKTDTEVISEEISVGNFVKANYDMELLNDSSRLLSRYYIVDATTKANPALFNAETLLSKDMSIKKQTGGPQILIYHTHASETFLDSRVGVEADTVVGAGNYLTELLTEYGFEVYHDRTAYDRLENGADNRNYAYSTAYPKIKEILAQYPTIQVVIDLHRDSGTKPTTVIGGKNCASIMFFNGLCSNVNGPISSLQNPYLEDNLAFSFQTAMIGRKLYDGIIYKNYLKNYRYNMHLMERCMLIELGTENNTVSEAYNAVEPLADILNQVLTNQVAMGE